LKLQITVDGKAYQLEVEVLEEDQPQRPPAYRPPAPAAPATPAPVAAAPAAPAVDQPVDERKACRSPVAGVVIRVLAKPGQAVQADELLLVLEAMKMETNVSAPAAGTIKTITVAEGDGVKVGQVLVTLD